MTRFPTRAELEAAWRDEQDAQPRNWRAEAARWKAAFENSERHAAELRAKIAAMDESLYALRSRLRQMILEEEST